MKHLAVLFLAALMAVPVLAQDKKAKETTVVGRVTDMKCYISGMTAEVPDHKECATECIKGGLPVGFVEEKTSSLFALVPAKGMKSANDELVKYAEGKVKLTGTLKEKGGTKMFFYTKVEEAK